MESVFLLWFVQELNRGEQDEILIGVYADEEDARNAISRLREKPGFIERPDGFVTAEYKIGEDHWTEGFKVDPA